MEIKANQIPILMYHNVHPTNPRHGVTTEDFEAHLQILKNKGYRAISMRDLYDRWTSNQTTDEKLVVLTFDDGCLGQFLYATPILEQFGFIAIFYVVGKWVGSANRMSWSDLQQLLGEGHEIGSHSWSHTKLTKLNPVDLNFELTQSQKVLSEKLNVPIEHFCYPFGRVNAETETAVRAVYQTATSTGSKIPQLTRLKRIDCDTVLPRHKPWPKKKWASAHAKVTKFFSDLE
jgi:peptidoglycan/xylan/chitin deacetylase (PgdA/CDA1 family)